MLLNQADSLLLVIDVQEKLVRHVLQHEHLISRCEWIVRLAVAMHVPILVSEQYPKGLGPTIPSIRMHIAEDDCIDKTYFSCMQSAPIIQRLNEHKKKHFILIGIEAHVCVLQTALEMKEAGLEVFIVVDAISSRHEIDLKYGLKRMKAAGIHLISAEMVFFEWLRHAAVPEFKMLSQQFLQA